MKVEMMDFLSKLYGKMSALPADPNVLNDLLLEFVSGLTTADQLQMFSADHSWIWDKVVIRHSSNPLFRQPAILLAYFAAKNLSRDDFRDLWPLSEAEYQIIFSDLGISTAHL